MITLLLLALLVLGLPVAFTLWPGLDRPRPFGVPLSWLLLGAAPFPVMVTLAWGQLRGAERAEDEP